MNSENRERETLMLIKCLRAARESLKESDLGVNGSAKTTTMYNVIE